MSKQQKIVLVAATLCYALVIYAFFELPLPFIILFFVLHSILLISFCYLCYRAHADYTGAEHLQQEIGILSADKEALRATHEQELKVRDEERDALNTRIGEQEEQIRALTEETESLKSELTELKEKEEPVEDLISFLPPAEEDENATIDIIATAKQAVADFRDPARKAGLNIQVSSAMESLKVRASRTRILIMFRNIIDNSIKYMKRAGTLVITVSAIDDDIFIVLKDTGNGLPEEETKHIFELNYQGSNRISGNGLGLTQAKAIVEYYGGTIYAKSNTGNGMGIYIQLPTT